MSNRSVTDSRHEQVNLEPLLNSSETILMQISESYLSEPVTIEFPTDNNQTAFMNYYPPKNQDYKLPQGQMPPLLIKIHGGPTSQASTAFNLGYQYWTSRGQSSVIHLSC